MNSRDMIAKLKTGTADLLIWARSHKLQAGLIVGIIVGAILVAVIF